MRSSEDRCKRQVSFLSIVVGLGAALASSCGGAVEAPDDEALAGVWPEDARTEALDPLLGDVLDVSGGAVRAGFRRDIKTR